MKYFYPIAIVIILILSAVFRLGFPDSAPFGVDEDKVACKISNFIDSQKLPPLLGKIHGVYTISIYSILVYLVMSFAYDPRIITLFMAGIPNTIAVVLCFMFCYKFFDKRIAIVAAALFGFSNWAIMYSKSFLGVDMLQFFSILTFFILMMGLYKSRPHIVLLFLFF